MTLLPAQSRGFEFVLAGGAVLPANSATRSATAGAVLQLALVQGPSAGRSRARFGVDAFRAPLRAADGGARRAGHFLQGGVTYDVLLGPARRATAPYGVLGLGASVSGETVGDGWPGFMVTGRTGVGVRHRLSRGELFAEATLTSAVAGLGGWARPFAVWWPLSVGITF
ncbi:MAG TPA: hypothetical protein PKE51_08610 [Gemmatimonadaceae bacterium]|nr:hypothetical protein [Gemmatimonadaceae bacterium]